MGDHRRNLLESADFSLQVAERMKDQTGSLSEYRSVAALLDAFEYTLEPGSEAKKDILREKEEIEDEKNKAKQKYQIDKDRLGFFERQDIERTMEQEIEIHAIKRRLEHCWKVANQRGQFND
jgi:hypothetical protein